MKINKKDLQKIIRETLLEVTEFGEFSLDTSIKKSFSGGQVGGGSVQDDFFDSGSSRSSGDSTQDSDSSFEPVDLGNVKALFVGDSQTYWPGVSYANRLLASDDIKGKNISKNGASLSKIKSFLRQGMMQDKYDVITIMGGGNDSHKSAPDYSIYDDMYDVVKRGNTLLIAITNPTKNNLSKEKRSKYPSNEKLANHVRLNSKPDVVIDVNKEYSDKSYFNSDMVHINSKAHKRLANQWRQLVFQKLKSRVS